MLTKEQMDGLPGLVTGLQSEHDSDFVYAMEEFLDLAPTLAATVIEQQAEIERLRDHLLKMLNQLHGRPVKHPGQMHERTSAYIALGATQ